MRDIRGKTQLLAAVALSLVAFGVSAQTVSKESAAAQGRAMGAAYNVGAGLISSGIGAISSAIKDAVTGAQETKPADVQVNGAQGAAAVLAVMSTAPSPSKAAPEGSDEQYARTPRASFEAAVDKAVAVLPEERRADVKVKAMADFDSRVARFNANAGLTNAALPIALDSVNVALKTQ